MQPPCRYALKHDFDHDGKVSESEWKSFVCEGCDPGSVCLKGDRLKDSVLARTNVKIEQFPSTCGDGTDQPPGCKWSFDSINKVKERIQKK